MAKERVRLTDPAIGVRERVIANALKRVGKARYVFGRDGEVASDGVEEFDCSGLTKKVYAEATAGMVIKPLFLPHNALAQAEQLWHPRAHGDHIHSGDILFYYQPITHCGIAQWENGKLWVIQASNPEVGVNRIGYADWAPLIAVGRPKVYLDKLRTALGYQAATA